MRTLAQQPCICIFSALYAPSTGGVEIFTENLASQLAGMGCRVIVVTSNTHGLPAKETINGVEIVRLPCTPLLNGRLPIPKKNAEHMALMRELESIPMDAILINTRFYPHSLIAARFAAKKELKPVLLDHGSAHLTLGNPLLDAALQAYEHLMTRRIKKHDVDFYGISDASVRWLAHFGITAKGAITNAMDAKAFTETASCRDFRKELGIPKNALLVAFTGRLVPEKGITPLLEAASILSDAPGIQFVLAGDGPLLDQAQHATSNVHALGRLSRPDIAALLIQSDIFCLPTRSEGFSTSLLEAAVCGCAPIITKVGGVKELIPDGSFGIVLEAADGRQIADAILELHDSPALRRSMAARIKEHAGTFTWAQTANAVLDAFSAAASGSVTER